ncbi:Hypothetical predicted protein [Marmota monax]|uniref:Uncharacterized protein n=1 Tax=Marmota monax TaxID=9995 RepID=A0A5E4BJA5_MARMO|nr:Hypothetical predicted protein [Marmota monax]
MPVGDPARPTRTAGPPHAPGKRRRPPLHVAQGQMDLDEPGFPVGLRNNCAAVIFALIVQGAVLVRRAFLPASGRAGVPSGVCGGREAEVPATPGSAATDHQEDPTLFNKRSLAGPGCF